MRKSISEIKFCLFVGYPRSGHSLVGSVIDAHENAVLAHEFNVLKKFKNFNCFDALKQQLIKNSVNQAKKGRIGQKLLSNGKVEMSYKYFIPGQGSFKKLKVIGDKRGFDTSLLISDCLDEFKNFIKMPIKFIHVIRNPYDNISTMSKILGIDNSISYYNSALKAINKIKSDAEILDLYSEQLIKFPNKNIRKLMDFLDLDCFDEYIAKCSNIIFKKAHKTRHDRKWSKKEIIKIDEMIDNYEWLSSYVKWSPQ